MSRWFTPSSSSCGRIGAAVLAGGAVSLGAHGCGSDLTPSPQPSGLESVGGQSLSGTGTGGALTGGTAAVGGASSGGSSDLSTGGECAAPVTGADLHPGNYDYVACSKCHSGLTPFWGGWVYNNSIADVPIGGATIELNNSDGTTVTAPTADDGFFTFASGIGSEFVPCVSKCPDSVCASGAHTSPHCQDAACHGGSDRHIYLTQSQALPGTGGSSGANCTPPTSGGARLHAARDLDGPYFSCRYCHDERYTGGWVYDGVTSSNVVSMATVTITPEDGPPIVSVTGYGGMFFLGTVGEPSTFAELKAPYIACVGKCPSPTICSAPGTHTTTANCGDCHNESLRIYVQ